MTSEKILEELRFISDRLSDGELMRSIVLVVRLIKMIEEEGVKEKTV